MRTRSKQTTRMIKTATGLALVTTVGLSTSRSQAQQTTVTISESAIPSGANNMTLLDGPAKCPGGGIRTGSPMLTNTWAVYPSGAPTQSSCNNARWATSNPGDCQFLVDFQANGGDTSSGLACITTASVTPGNSGEQTYTKLVQFTAPPWGEKEDKVFDPQVSGQTRVECTAHSMFGENTCQVDSWVSSDPSDLRCRIHYGGNAFSQGSCEAFITYKAAPPPVPPPPNAGGVRQLLSAQGNPVVRFTGSLHDWSAPIPAMPDDDPKSIESLQTTIQTGGDDLRGGHNAGDNADVYLTLRSGQTLPFPNVNQGGHWNNNEVHTINLSVPGTTKVGDIASIRLHTGFGGGMGGDNWNVNQVVLQATVAALGPAPVAQAPVAPGPRPVPFEPVFRPTPAPGPEPRFGPARTEPVFGPPRPQLAQPQTPRVFAQPRPMPAYVPPPPAAAPPPPVVSAPDVITVTKARIGCLDIQTDGNLTAIVAQACNSKGSCAYKAPTESEYKRDGVQARTRSFCSQGMAIDYQCRDGRSKSVSVPGDAWTHPPAVLSCAN